MPRFISPITDIKPLGSVSFFDVNTNANKLTYKDELETIANLLTVPVDAGGNLPNIFFSGSASVVYLDQFDVQYAARNPVGEEVGIGNFTPWVNVITYSSGDITIGSNGSIYISYTDGNQGNDPVTSPTNWEEIRFIGVWDANIIYDTGSVVQTADGNLWRSVVSQFGNDPSTDDGTNWLVAVSITLPEINQPTNISPASGITEVGLPVTLTSSTATGTDLHIQSIWTVYSDAGAATEVYNSGAISDIVSHVVPDGALLGETQYWWRVQYVGVSSFSLASALTDFTSDLAFSSLFATTLYTGSGTTQDIVSGLDFVAGEGLVWGKSRTGGFSHLFQDTLRGVGVALHSDTTAAENATTTDVTSFNADGFSVGNGTINQTGNIVAWQFMEAKGFFDIVEYTGDGIAGRTVALDLDNGGSAVFGMCLIKTRDSAANWAVQHKSLGGTQELYLDSTSQAYTDIGAWNNTAATSTEITLGSNGRQNQLNDSFIAYAFAHNPAKGIFCGSYTGTGVAGNKVTTGFPVGWLLIKCSSTVSDWDIYDVTRAGGLTLNKKLSANTTTAESTFAAINSLSDGFDFTGSAFNVSGSTYIYMAIADPAQF